MSQEEFVKFVTRSLNDLHTKCDTLEESVEQQKKLTKEVVEIVELGRGLFNFAYRLGSILKWLAGAFGGAMLIWHFISEKVKGFLQ